MATSKSLKTAVKKEVKASSDDARTGNVQTTDAPAPEPKTEPTAPATANPGFMDLPTGARSGLAEARELLSGIEGIAMCHFTEVDVVRHPLVQRIIVVYERRDAELAERRAEEKRS